MVLMCSTDATALTDSYLGSESTSVPKKEYCAAQRSRAVTRRRRDKLAAR